MSSSKSNRDLVSSVAPQFVVSDVAATAEHYRDRLGFAIGRFSDDPPKHAIVTRDRAEIFLKLAGEKTGKPNRSLDDDGIDAYIRVKDLDEIHRDLLHRGANLKEGPVTRSYGQRELVIEDNNGFILVFGEECEEEQTNPGKDRVL